MHTCNFKSPYSLLFLMHVQIIKVILFIFNSCQRLIIVLVQSLQKISMALESPTRSKNHNKTIMLNTDCATTKKKKQCLVCTGPILYSAIDRYRVSSSCVIAHYAIKMGFPSGIS